MLVSYVEESHLGSIIIIALCYYHCSEMGIITYNLSQRNDANHKDFTQRHRSSKCETQIYSLKRSIDTNICGLQVHVLVA